MKLISTKQIALFSGLFLIASLAFFQFLNQFGNLSNSSGPLYFVYQASSFLNGRLDLPFEQIRLDLTMYKGKLYAYWSPLVSVLMLPLVGLFKSPAEFPYRIFAMVLGAIASALYLVLALSIFKLNKRNLRQKLLLALAASWGSSNIIFSMVANHWFVGQLAANVMLTIAIIILISRERTRKNVRAVLGFCFFALAILGRNHIVFTFPFFLYLVISDDSFRLEGPGNFIRRYLKSIRDNYVLVLLVCLPVITIIFMIALYNYLRFDDFLFKGIELSNMRRTSRELTDQHGLVNFKYLFRNIYVTLLRPPGAGLIDGFYRDEGFSIFLQSSFLLSIFFVRSTPFSKDFLIAGLIGVSCCSLFVLCWVGSGYRQFGARYLFDSFPVLMAILIFAEPRIKNRMLLALTMISILLNVFGCFYFTNSFRQYNLF